MDDRITEIEDSVKRLAAGVKSNWDRMVESTAEYLGAVEAEVADLKKRVETLEGALGGVLAGANDRFGRLETRIADLEHEFNRLWKGGGHG
jgi:hypothetical protein